MRKNKIKCEPVEEDNCNSQDKHCECTTDEKEKHTHVYFSVPNNILTTHATIELRREKENILHGINK